MYFDIQLKIVKYFLNSFKINVLLMQILFFEGLRRIKVLQSDMSLWLTTNYQYNFDDDYDKSNNDNIPGYTAKNCKLLSKFIQI